MSLSDLADATQDASSFLALVTALAEDARSSPDEWENRTVAEYLEALAAWLSDSTHLEVGDDWRRVANAHLAAKFYE